MEPLLVTIMLWLSANFGLPANIDPPKLAFVSPSELVSPRYGLSVAAHTTKPLRKGMPSSAREAPEVLGLYSDKQRTVYLQYGWKGRTPAEFSILVHELVHHMQSAAALEYPCPEEREKLAYKAQDEWLHLFGRNPKASSKLIK